MIPCFEQIGYDKPIPGIAFVHSDFTENHGPKIKNLYLGERGTRCNDSNHMKIVTWNCNRAFRKKLHRMTDLDADLLVIQECENPARSGKEYDQYREWAGDYLWHGNNPNMGLGVFPRNGTCIERLNWSDDGLQLFLPCRVNSTFNLVNVWTKDARSHAYIGQLWKYLKIHKTKLAADSAVICGDFNSNAFWDRKKRDWNHSDVVQELAHAGIVSHYHHYHRLDHGRESQPTMFLLKNPEKPYHLDYAFTSGELLPGSNEMTIGDPDKWMSMSDHMPLIFTIID
jgi:endonuclease/exonuclease/phosphatase family metal-dependent hydrolase